MPIEKSREKRKRRESLKKQQQPHERHSESLLDKRARSIAKATASSTTSSPTYSALNRHGFNRQTSVLDLSLCKRCQSINPLWVFETSQTEDMILTHSPRDSFMSRCPLCELLQNAVLSITNGRTGKDARTGGFKIFLTWCWSRTRPEVRCLRGFQISLGARLHGDSAEGFVVSQPEVTRGLRLLESRSVDFTIIKEWIRSCDNHPSPCALERSSDTDIVPGMKLVDCTRKQVIKVTVQCISYVCLSYVWGQESDDALYEGNLPPKLPATMEDAITATLKLGFKYLWVDRYCIDQTNKSEVSHQIEMMDLIYQNAEFTIIAAAGADPFYGLPGVGSRRRHPNATANIWNTSLISVPYSPIRFLQESIWSTRGWTYQEAFFSRRRLVFTEQQAYFECNRMVCDETFKDTVEVEPLNWKHGSESVWYSGKRCLAFPTRAGELPGDVFKHIVNYSQRKLTKPFDIVNGILGTLRSFEIRYGIPHCWGTPSMLPHHKAASQKALFVDGLC